MSTRIIVAVIGLFILVACGIKRTPDYEVHVCLDQAGVTQEIVSMFRDVSSRNGYTFTDNGAEAKDDLLRIARNKSIIPHGRATNFHIRRKDGKIALMGSNFGTELGSDLVLAFFYYKDEGKNSSFNMDIMSQVGSIPNAQVYPRDKDKEGKSPCAR